MKNPKMTTTGGLRVDLLEKGAVGTTGVVQAGSSEIKSLIWDTLPNNGVFGVLHAGRLRRSSGPALN